MKPNITYQPVESSQIAAIGHHTLSKTLGIKFHPRKPEGQPSEYHYQSFPDDKFAEFQKAPSFGRYFGAEIRGKYKHTKIS